MLRLRTAICETYRARQSAISLISTNVYERRRKAKLTRPRPVRESISEMAEIVLPNDANPLNALAGRTADALDRPGRRHGRPPSLAPAYVVTASIDHWIFWCPCGSAISSSCAPPSIASFILPWRSGVKVWVENYRAEREPSRQLRLPDFCSHRCCRESHWRFRRLIPETDDEKRRYEDAAHRRRDAPSGIGAQESNPLLNVA